MTRPWLTIVGIGEDGVAGLSSAARAAVEGAEVIVGGDRHHTLAPDLKARRLAWPSPFDAMIDTLKEHRGRRIVVLATGDPLWYSVGARIARAIPSGEIEFHPQLSAFQWAAARMGWSLADVETLTAHGRPAEQIVPWFWPGARLIVLTAGAETPGQIARLLVRRGYGTSRLTVLANLGGPEEERLDGRADDWAAGGPAIPPFHTLAVECAGNPDPLIPRGPGLPDEAFVHDGKMTKREVRALTLARLMPVRGALLWDLGTGCGSVAIEWMRAARDARAIGIDQNPARLEMARRNAHALGVPKLELRLGTAPGALRSLPQPDAVFVGGAITEAIAEAALAALPPLGRLVANAVTLESEGVLLDLRAAHGGDLTRVSVQRAEAIGTRTGWRPAMPVIQWSLVKR
ncbi:MAG TPA: precorrin-6y C5,15-methyltransferase (decarboxylating) subunit CbiE [Thermohalobaculum sp.]|nr:precorrin-6y C5,15-methyltransferase (decarboxylating) subunit CbiE [Thermohalobaculum sp.]